MRDLFVRMRSVAFAPVALLVLGATPSLAQTKPPLIVAVPADLRGMDPHKISAGSDDNVFANVFENLYGVNIDGSLMPALAESSKVSDNGLVYDFKLREGVTFHNGDPFTAEDVVYSWKRGIDPQILNPRAILVLRNIENIEIIDPHRVRMTLKTPDAGTLFNMIGGFYIVSKKYMEGEGKDEATRKMIGTGPFRFVERKVNEYIKLAANDKHWGQVPKVGEVTLRIIPDSQARFATVQTGESDIATFVPAFIASKEGNAKDYKIVRGKSLVNVFMNIHTRSNNPDMKKPEVRRAFNMALDRPNLFKAIALGFGTMHDGASCGAAVFGCDPPPKGFGYDPRLARKMLEDAKFDFNRPVRVVAPATTGGSIPQARETAEAVAYSLQQIGVKTDLVIKEYAAWLAEDQQARQPKNPAGDIVMSMVQDNNINPGIRLKRTVVTDGVFSWFSDPKLDDVVNKLDTIQSDSERLAYSKQMWQQIHDLAPSIFLWSYDSVYAARSNIEWTPQFAALHAVLWNVVKK